MPDTFCTQRRVEFRDTDMAGIVHFSVFFTYMEEAEHQLLRHLGLGVITKVGEQQVSFPRVAAECNYRNAIRFEETIDIEVSVRRIGTKSITYDFLLKRSDTKIADGSITAVCCRYEKSHDGPPESIPIPPTIVDALQPFVKLDA